MDFIGRNDGDNILEDDESALITVWMVNYDYHPLAGNYYELGTNEDDPFIDNSANLLQAGDSFEIQIIPDKGATLSLARKLPPHLDLSIDLN